MSTRTVIESLGVFLPPREVLTRDVVQGCRHAIRLPLERLSGITSRRVAGDGSYSIDLAAEAVTRCLAVSRFGPRDVDLLIFTSVGRCDGPSLWISYEPSTAMRLRARFGFDRAIAFDVASACAGMFTGIHIADALLQSGAIRCALVVSGEYISHLADTAQKEIDGVLDRRLACLTLGDAGAAVMIAASSDREAGFDLLELCTVSQCAEYCVAGPTDQEHGGAIMHTDALKLTEAATRFGSIHALDAMQRARWTPADFTHLILHQTSRTGLNGAMREINRILRRPVCHSGNTIDNLALRGNTASTTHFVALADQIESGRIGSGDRVVFSISGSGLTIGTGLYRLDDLPDRMRRTNGGRNGHPKSHDPMPVAPAGRGATGVRVSAVGHTARSERAGKDTLTLLDEAITDCVSRWGKDRGDLDLLVYAGTYRTGFTSEPAIAALAAGRAGINVTLEPEDPRRTLAFDVLNGSLGFLNACHVAAEMIQAGKSTAAMILGGDVENNREAFPAELLGLEETGSAIVLERAAPDAGGFGTFVFTAFPDHLGAFTSRAANWDRKTGLAFRKDADIECRYVQCIATTVRDFLKQEGLEWSAIARVFAPQISSCFLARLAAALELPLERLVDVVSGGRDLYTSSLPFALRHALHAGLVASGDTGLFIGAGAGIQVGCASYRF